MSLARWEVEALAALVLLIAGCVGLYFYDKHQQAIGAASITGAVQAATATAVAADAAKAASVAASQARNLQDALDQNASLQADARRLAALAARVQHGAPRSGGAVYAAAASAAASSASSVPPTGMVREELYFWALQRAIDASGYADCLRTAGSLCASNYDSTVTP